MRCALVLLWMLFWPVPAAMAQVSIGVGLPGVSIGINLPLFPELVQVPDYPVYYAPRMNSNYFFYDGMYWVYQRDNWYASSWYNGPWGLVGPELVPLYVLRIPVRYYRDPPGYFRGWRTDAPPRWGEHWGNAWQQQRSGWDRWNRASAPAPAPLPVYQRQYSGERYPRVEQQQTLHSQNYHYQPRDTVVRQHFQEQGQQKASAPASRGQQGTPQERGDSRQPDMQRPKPPAQVQQSAPTTPFAQPPQRGSENVQRSAPAQAAPQQRGENVQRSAPAQVSPQKGGENVQRSAPIQASPQQGGENVQRLAPSQSPPRGPAAQDQRQQSQQCAAQREAQTPRPRQETGAQGKGPSQQPGRGQGQEKEREKGDEKAQERNK